ncbi:MAG TPA: sigma-70 family RNA polymerase sigma factor, partial [Candidatus Dormibacteraeota bacterium]|nr:sigma-70 family RNA polymerase sigma factor [Candidatus Dormibacteraeota bacterium]
EDLSYPELAARLQLNEGALRVALHRLRRRYGECVRDEIAKLVQRPEDIEDELRHLFAALR